MNSTDIPRNRPVIRQAIHDFLSTLRSKVSSIQREHRKRKAPGISCVGIHKLKKVSGTRRIRNRLARATFSPNHLRAREKLIRELSIRITTLPIL
jgi:hypothetical protein